VKQESGEKIRCPLCDHRFSRQEQECAGNCGLFGNCGLVCCPGCGYSFVAESRTVRLFRNLFNRKRAKELKP